MHGRLGLALLALSLLLPATAQAATPGQDIRKVDAWASSAGALVRVTLRGPLRGPIAVSFRPRPGIRGNSRPATTIERGRRVDFLFRGDARNLDRVLARTGADRVTRRISHPAECDALTRLARKLRPLRKSRRVVRARLRAIARKQTTCGVSEGGTTVPIDQPAPPAPLPGPGFTPPAARFALADGLTPTDPLSAGATVAFNDASQGTDLVGFAWDFGDGVKASGRSVQHAFAQPGRYTVLLTVRNARGQTSAFGVEVFVRAPGSAIFNGPETDCPGPGETVTVQVTRVVPSWAKLPASVSYDVPGCSATVSNAADLEIVAGNSGGVKDAWGRTASTLRFTFEISNGDGVGTVIPEVTASWG